MFLASAIFISKRFFFFNQTLISMRHGLTLSKWAETLPVSFSCQLATFLEGLPKRIKKLKYCDHSKICTHRVFQIYRRGRVQPDNFESHCFARLEIQSIIALSGTGVLSTCEEKHNFPQTQRGRLSYTELICFWHLELQCVVGKPT